MGYTITQHVHILYVSEDLQSFWSKTEMCAVFPHAATSVLHSLVSDSNWN